jgi:hypothetical protein
MKPDQAAFLLCALLLGGCDADTSEPLEEPSIEDLFDAPNGREIMLSFILRNEVIVFSSEFLPHDGLWAGHGDVPLAQAAWECSGGLTITQHAGEYLQVIAPAPGTHFGENSSANEIAQCVSERANERFSVSLQENALQLLSLTGGQQIMPSTYSEDNVGNASSE